MLCFRCGTYNPEGSAACVQCGARFTVRSKPPSPAAVPPPIKKTLLPLGHVLAGRYELSRFVGSGPVGEVFYARDRVTSADVAVKLFRPALFPDARAAERFMWGLRGLKDISLPNLGRMYDVEAADEGFVYQTMRYIQGVPLSRSIEIRRPIGEAFNLSEIEPLFNQLREALTELHPAVVHGDLKPGNIIVQPDFLKITDLGLAEFLPRDTFAQAQRGAADAACLAPEILVGGAPVPACDIFSIGRLFALTLVGATPDDPQAARFYGGDDRLDDMIRAFYAKAAHEDPAKRFKDVAALFASLEEIFARYHELPASRRTVSKIGAAGEFNEAPLVVELAEAKAPAVSGEPARAPKPEVPPEAARAPEVKPPPAGAGLQPSRLGVSLVAAFLAALLIIGGLLYGVGRFVTVPPGSGARDAAVAADAGKPAHTVMAFSDLDVEGKAAPEKIAEEAGARKPPREKAEEARPARAEKPDKAGKPERPEKPEKAEKTEKPAKPAAEEKTTAAQKHEKPEPAGPACPKGTVAVGAGKFFMGSQPGEVQRNPDEKAWEPTSSGAYCIDLYEYPNAKGVMPRTLVSLSEAEKLCKDAGKRLCTEEEWERACKGPSMTRYPYGNAGDPAACNTESGSGEERKVVPAGKFAGCKSKYGPHDMSGNVAEWVSGKSGAVVKGGASNKPDWATRCASRMQTASGKKNTHTGFRCCADAKGTAD